MCSTTLTQLSTCSACKIIARHESGVFTARDLSGRVVHRDRPNKAPRRTGPQRAIPIHETLSATHPELDDLDARMLGTS